MDLPGGTTISALSGFGLFVMYFFGSFYFLRDKAFDKQILSLSIISGVFLSVIPVGVLSKIMNWPGYEVLLLIGVASLPLLLIAIFVIKYTTKKTLDNYFKNLLIRVIFWMILSYVSLFMIYPTYLS
jgi:hypothetical protein